MDAERRDRASGSSRPIVFLSDYGLEDEFVGVCHGVIARISPSASIVDLHHAIPPQNVLRGALTLADSADFMPSDAVYLAIVDPGVGSSRLAIAVEAAGGAVLIGPDNGVLSLAWEQLGGAARAFDISSETVMLDPVSKTFHGRDVLAPAAAHVAAGMRIEELGPPVGVDALRRVSLPRADVRQGRLVCEVIGVDRFGNVQLNVRPHELEAASLGDRFVLGATRVTMVETFSDLAQGELGAVWDARGWLAMFVNRGSAADVLRLAPGSRVALERPA